MKQALASEEAGTSGQFLKQPEFYPEDPWQGTVASEEGSLATGISFGFLLQIELLVRVVAVWAGPRRRY